MTIIDEVRESFKDVKVGTEFSTQEVIDHVLRKYKINRSSIIPSDYCYNLTNVGKQANKTLDDFKIFIHIERGRYKYVGENYSE